MAGGFTPWGVVRIVYAGGLLIYTGVIFATLIQVQDIHMSLGLIGVVLALAGLSLSLVSTVAREITGQVRDENSGTPGEKNTETPIPVRKKVEVPDPGFVQPPAVPNQLSGADEIKKYKLLLDEAIITLEEFNKKKKDLLNS